MIFRTVSVSLAIATGSCYPFLKGKCFEHAAVRDAVFVSEVPRASRVVRAAVAAAHWSLTTTEFRFLKPLFDDDFYRGFDPITPFVTGWLPFDLGWLVRRAAEGDGSSELVSQLEWAERFYVRVHCMLCDGTYRYAPKQVYSIYYLLSHYAAALAGLARLARFVVDRNPQTAGALSSIVHRDSVWIYEQDDKSVEKMRAAVDRALKDLTDVGSDKRFYAVQLIRDNRFGMLRCAAAEITRMSICTASMYFPENDPEPVRDPYAECEVVLRKHTSMSADVLLMALEPGMNSESQFAKAVYIVSGLITGLFPKIRDYDTLFCHLASALAAHTLADTDLRALRHVMPSDWKLMGAASVFESALIWNTEKYVGPGPVVSRLMSHLGVVDEGKPEQRFADDLKNACAGVAAAMAHIREWKNLFEPDERPMRIAVSRLWGEMLDNLSERLCAQITDWVAEKLLHAQPVRALGLNGSDDAVRFWNERLKAVARQKGKG